MTSVRDVADRLECELPELRARHAIPGLAIGLCNRAGLVWSASYGTTTADGATSVTSRTRFGVQSCSKMYTAAVAVIMAQEGLVDLDESITTYLPEFHVNSWYETHPERKMTLRHLLSHTAGFTHEAPVGSNYLIGRASFAAHCRSIADTWLRFPVGHHYEYSNLGIDLAGFLLARIAGTSFPEVARRNLFVPLGLDSTTFDWPSIRRDPERALGHSHGRRAPGQVPMLAAGGLYTTVEDACRYVQHHLSDALPSLDEVYRVPFADQDYGYGLGIVNIDHDGVLIRGHSGGGFGFLSDIYWAPDHDIGVVVLTNSVDHPLQWSLAARIFTDLTRSERDRPALPAEVPQPADVRARLSGAFIGRGFDTASVKVEASPEVLLLNGERHPIRLTGAREFVDTDTGQHYRLLGDHNGQLGYLQRCSDGYTLYRNDVPADPVAGEPNGPWNRTYTVKKSSERWRLLQTPEGFFAIHTGDNGQTALRLSDQGNGLFATSTGETLDLTQTPPTLANVQLHVR